MNEMDELSGDVYTVCEAVVLRNAMSMYLSHTARTYKDHEAEEYKLTMQFLTGIYKKYNRLASTRIELDASGRYVVKRDIRKNIDLN